MSITKFMAAINQICDEKGITKDKIVEIIETALAAAYRKDYGMRGQEVEVKLDEESGFAKVYLIKEVSKNVEDEYFQISLENAKKINPKAKIGESIKIEDTPEDYGRIAAQTAKQVITQKIKEAEREIMFSEYKSQEGKLLNGIIQQVKNNNIIIDLGKAAAIMFPSDQIPGERYHIGQRIRILLVKVEDTLRGPQIVVSRSHPDFLTKLFELEVPEIPAGTVEIKSVSREAGDRSKIAVYSNQEGVDPVGSCVGQRGMRVQSILTEIGKEKIDIILWSEKPEEYIANSLSPSKVTEVEVTNKSKKESKVRVPDDQLSLAIGKNGQNVRLAVKLTGWKIDIEGADNPEEIKKE